MENTQQEREGEKWRRKRKEDRKRKGEGKQERGKGRKKFKKAGEKEQRESERAIFTIHITHSFIVILAPSVLAKQVLVFAMPINQWN